MRPNNKRKGGALDASRTAAVAPLAEPQVASPGGSAMGGAITEATFLPRPGYTFVDSPYGERYLAHKSTALVYADTQVRLSVWACSYKGYHDYGTFTLGLPIGVTDGYQILQDWYKHVRDMGKRALKYKHTPETLSDYSMLLYYLDTYHYVIANLTTLLNLNRMPMYSTGFSKITGGLPTYMSRITRLWRRASALKAPNFVKQHAVRSGMIVASSPRSAPVVRFWSPKFLLESGSGGPSLTDIAATSAAILTAASPYTNLGKLVANLEVAERWLEVGTATIATDFNAVKDLIDMTSDIVPGSFAQGLPDPKGMPGLLADPALLTDIYARALTVKDIVTAGTDRWIIFPVPAISNLNSLIPVAGYGKPSMYDFTLLGSPKFGVHNASMSTIAANVNTACRFVGTDVWLRDSHSASDQAIEDVFGVPTGTVKEGIIDGNGTTTSFYDAFDSNTASEVRKFQQQFDSMRVRHIWMDLRYADRDSWVTGWERKINENAVDYMFFMPAEDLGKNYAEFLAQQLGIPYLGIAGSP